ncbi:DUF6585 family protein [Nocardia sp. NBC_00511]|uniref:DUF6585 family protein n=1 Tax=Nocardia sp. NBC_00511 TaxID=2903591 RepID=UPI0030E106F3
MSGLGIDVGNDPDLMRRIGDTATEYKLGEHRTHHLGRKIGARLDIYERGAVVVLGGQQLRVVRNEIAKITQKVTRHTRNGVHTGTTHHYRVTDVRGEEVLLTEAICCPEQWGPQLVEAIASYQAGAAIDTLRAGQRLEFGPWWLSATQAGTDKHTFALTELRGFRVKGGQVTIEARDDIRITKSIDKFPNFLLFQYLLRKLLPNLPESAGKVFDRRLTVRGFNIAFAIIAVIAFVIACANSWPVDRSELCDKLSAVQKAGSELTSPVKDLRDAASNYRGDDQSGVRDDAKKLGAYTGSGFHWVKESQLDDATASIRAVCQAKSFQSGK